MQERCIQVPQHPGNLDNILYQIANFMWLGKYLATDLSHYKCIALVEITPNTEIKNTKQETETVKERLFFTRFL